MEWSLPGIADHFHCNQDLRTGLDPLFSDRVFGTHVWRRDPPCARRHNKEYLLNSLPTIESSTPAFHGIISGTPDARYWLVDMPIRHPKLTIECECELTGE